MNSNNQNNQNNQNFQENTDHIHADPQYLSLELKAKNTSAQNEAKRSDADGFGEPDQPDDFEDAQKNPIQNIQQKNISDGQIINLNDDATIHSADVEQQVEYALAQKDSFFKRNLKKIALIGVAVCGGGVAVALANFKTKVTVAQTTTVEQVAVPETDKSKLVNPSQTEKEQRNLVDQQQAQNALENGQTYTPEFTPQGMQASQLMPPAPVDMPPTPPQAAQEQAPQYEPMPAASPPPDSLSESEMTKVRDSVYGQVDNLVKANNSQNGFNTVVYARKSNDKDAANFYNQMPDTQQGHIATDQNKSIKKKYRVTAGGMMYATLNQAVNSDDGLGAVFATLHGGPFNGATLIGKIDEAPSNIRLTFSQITTRDGETIDISATAIREKDARAGMAEGIDNHTISRYSSLFIASFLKGLGQFAKPPSSLMSNNSSIFQTQEEPNAKHIVRGGLGETGTALSAEAKENFRRAPTYTIPQNQSFAVLFLKNIE